MKYAIVLGLVGVMGFAMGCEETPTTTTSSSSSGAGGESTVSSSSSSSGMGGMGTGGMGTGGMGTGGMGTGGMGTGGMGTGGMGTGGMGTGGMGTGGMGTGGAGGSGLVCDDATVVDKDDPAMRCANGVPTDVATPIMAPANMVWASAVAMNGVSSEYSMGVNPMDYHAVQATGAPNVYPESGDRPEAWASAMEDNQVEFIKVTYATPVVAKAVWVYETLNPGAISKITITAMDGDHVVYTKATPATVGTCSHILSASTKTCSPISAVRVELDSPKVTGFNEIDAIGLVPAQ